ncbi:MAG TPA: hypothetical protein VFW09_04000, partial [Solirubrobacteraceae bacterium]|nr:hypothetical protein [Solirubrobacteraceae bacterium]
PWADPAVRDAGFVSYLQRLWFDTHVHSVQALHTLAEIAGTERLVYGTNFAGWDAEAPGTDLRVPGVDLAVNAQRLLRLPARTNRPADR